MLLKSLVLVAFFSLPLLSCTDNISTLCQKKLLDSHAFGDETLSLKLQHNKYLLYSEKKLHNFLKYDPFLHLYLVEKKDDFKFPFLFVKKQTKHYITNSKKTVVPTQVRKLQVGLNVFATYNKKVDVPSVVTDYCCALEGIVTKRGVIEKAYIEHFIKSKSSDYADFSFRVKRDAKSVVVSKVDYFIKNTPFKVGDIILEMDGKKAPSPSLFMQKVLFSKIGSKHTFKIKRGKKIFSVSQTALKRLAGGFVKETFLEHIGFYFDKEYRLMKKNPKYQLKKGDKLLFINSKKIEYDDDIYRAFNPHNDNKFLIQRGGFSFIITIKAMQHNERVSNFP